MLAFLIALATLSLATVPSDALPEYSTRPYGTLQRRLFDATALSVCQKLQPSRRVYYVASPSFVDAITRYMSNTAQTPTCVFKPERVEELATGLRLIGESKVAFAVSSGRHASNVGFSSTTGVQIDLKGFQHIKLAEDKSYVEIGSGAIWDSVYQALDGTGVNVLGGRVSGVGVGGMLAGGGGFSWKTNQYGVGGDSLLSASMVLPNGTLAEASETKNADLFWAIKGGGNQFGIVYKWCLKTYPQSAQVYGGFRVYTADQTPQLIQAVSEFAAKNTDPKAQIVPSFVSAAGVPLVTVIGFYDGPDPGKSLSYFDNSSSIFTVGDSWRAQSFYDMVRSIPTNTTAGVRGLFHTLSLRTLSPTLTKQIANQSAYWGSPKLGRSAVLVSYNIEPFLDNWADGKAKDAAWPHADSPQPFNLQFSWTNPLDDDFFHRAAIESLRLITAQANAEGQALDTMALYPNYALASTASSEVFRGSLPRLSALKKQYDPTGIMRRTAYFGF